MSKHEYPNPTKMGETLAASGARLECARSCALALIQARFPSRDVAAYLDEARAEARRYLNPRTARPRGAFY